MVTLRFKLHADTLWPQVAFRSENGKKEAIMDLADDLEGGPYRSSLDQGIKIGRFHVGTVKDVKIVDDGLAVSGRIEWFHDKVDITEEV